MTIKEVSQKYDLSPDTIRYYERIGLIPPVPRKPNGIRDFDQESCNWIEFIKCMRSAGLILAVVGTLASFKAASLGNQVVTTQNEAFNHWSNYQAKTIKKTTLETELYTIEIELAKLKDTDNALKLNF